MMKSSTHLKMGCSRYFVVLLLIPSLAFAASTDEWTGRWFPWNRKLLRTSTPTPKLLDHGGLDEFIEHWTGKWFPGFPSNDTTTPMTPVQTAQRTSTTTAHVFDIIDEVPIDDKFVLEPMLEDHEIDVIPPVVRPSPSKAPLSPVKPSLGQSFADIPDELAEIELSPPEPAEVVPSPAKPAEVVPSPAEPAEVVPSPVKPAEYAPSPAEPAEVVPSPAKPAEVAPSPFEPAEVVPPPAEAAPSPAEPVKVVPSPAEPAEVVPSPAEPVEVVPSPAEPAEVVPSPVKPAEDAPSPAEVAPSPAGPAEVVASPVEPGEVVPSPAEPVKVVPSPAEPAEIVPSPAEPAEVVPSPAEPAEVAPSPAEPAEVVPSPAEPAAVTPSPAEPAEVVPSPAEPAEVLPAPAEPVEVLPAPSEPLAPAEPEPISSTTTAEPVQVESSTVAELIPEAPLPPSTEEPSVTHHSHEDNIEHWTGKWSADSNRTTTPLPSAERQENTTMGITTSDCDNAKDHLHHDFDVANITQSVVYVCLSDRTQFMPNINLEPILREYDIPPAYRPLHQCMDVEIRYETKIPTFGDHRPLWPKYGQYKYVPPQRWLHNIEHGAIVMLYHPCANYNQVEKLKMLVKSCIYRHIITPSSDLLGSDRPLALVAWGKSLEMSVVDEETVINFIKRNALRGLEMNSNNGQYEKLLLQHADIVSNIDDNVICPNIADPLQKYLLRRKQLGKRVLFNQ